MVLRACGRAGKGICGLLLITLPALSDAIAAPDFPLQIARLHAAQKPVESQYVKESAAHTSPEDHLARRAITATSHHDPSNQDLKFLQNYDAAVAGIPKDPLGFPDWMRALKEGAIKPRSTLSGKDVSADELNLDIVMKNTKEMPWVKFPHLSHTMWLTCSNCHPYPFAARSGATKIKMADIFQGKYCGMCHDRVAFITFFSCMRCHSVPQAEAVKK